MYTAPTTQQGYFMPKVMFLLLVSNVHRTYYTTVLNHAEDDVLAARVTVHRT